MVGFIVFLSVFATMGIAWFGATLAYVLRVGGVGRLLSLSVSEFVLVMAGLFCPIIVLALGLAFVYLALELRKIQLLLNRRIPAAHVAVTDVKEDKPKTAPDGSTEEAKEVEPLIQDRPVLNISTQESIEKYKDISLPDNLDLHFVDKT